MAVWLFVAFVVLPLVELYLLLTLGSWLGFWPTVVIALVTALLGGALAKREGFRVLRAWWDALGGGRTPDAGLLDGVLVLVGAVLLMTPGFISDVAGLLLMFRPTRRVAATLLRQAVDRRLAAGTLRVETVTVHARRGAVIDPLGVVDTVGEGVDDPADGGPGSPRLPLTRRGD